MKRDRKHVWRLASVLRLVPHHKVNEALHCVRTIAWTDLNILVEKQQIRLQIQHLSYSSQNETSKGTVLFQFWPHSLTTLLPVLWKPFLRWHSMSERVHEISFTTCFEDVWWYKTSFTTHSVGPSVLLSIIVECWVHADSVLLVAVTWMMSGNTLQSLKREISVTKIVSRKRFWSRVERNQTSAMKVSHDKLQSK